MTDWGVTFHSFMDELVNIFKVDGVKSPEVANNGKKNPLKRSLTKLSSSHNNINSVARRGSFVRKQSARYSESKQLI